MSSTYIEVQNALELISPMVMTLADAGLEIGAQVCANLIYGLQNCSCNEESVRRILFVALSFAKDLISKYSVTPNSVVGENAAVYALQEAICIHQALSLSVQVLPGLSLDNDLLTEMRTQQELVYHVIEMRKNELPPYRLSPAERRLADSISDVLIDEPFVVTCGELLHGFESCIVIRLRPGISLVTKEGIEWNPVLNIEVAGPKDCYPKQELFSRLRAQYLFQEMGVVVQTIPYTSLAGQSRSSLRDLLRRTNDLFNAIYPPTIEDAANFNAILLNMGLVKGEGLLSSLSPDNRYAMDPHMNPESASSFFSLGNGEVMVGSGMDDFDPLPTDEAVNRLQQRSFRPPLSMMIGWIGELPVVSITPHATPRTSPTMNYSSNQSSRRSASNKSFKTVSSSPMPPGYSARSVYPPFVQIGPPVHNTGQPAITVLPPTRGSTNPRQPPYSKASQVSYNVNSRHPSNSATVIGLSSTHSDSELVRSGSTPELTNLRGNSTVGEETEVHDGDQKEEASEVDSEIALLEAQLEIKRLEAKLLLLKKSKSKPAATTPTAGPTSANTTESNSGPATAAESTQENGQSS
jgi:hypothetical protein